VVVSTVFPQCSPKFFTSNAVVRFLEVDTACVDVFCILPRFLKNLLENENLVCIATAATKSALGIIQLWFNYFAASLFKAFGNVNVRYLKIPKQHRGPHAARVFETPGLECICSHQRRERFRNSVLKAQSSES